VNHWEKITTTSQTTVLYVDNSACECKEVKELTAPVRSQPKQGSGSLDTDPPYSRQAKREHGDRGQGNHAKLNKQRKKERTGKPCKATKEDERRLRLYTKHSLDEVNHMNPRSSQSPMETRMNITRKSNAKPTTKKR